MFSLESLIFLISSLISVGLIYFQVPKSGLFVFLSVLIAVLLVFFSRFQLAFLQNKEHRFILLLALFVCSLFIQLLLIATGGFFSAFIIVLHLFTLGMSLLLNVRSSIFFLLLSVGVLCSMILFDPQTVVLFKQDPWAFLLHGVSFLVVIPLAHMMVSTYHLKDAIAKVLSESLKTKEMQDESIFRGIGEFVLILNKDLKVVFANEALKKSLNLEDGEVANKNLYDILPIQSTIGVEVNSQTLSIDQAIADKSAHIVKGFYFASKQGTKMPVTIQVRPIYEQNETLKQIILVMTTDKTGTVSDSVDIKLASLRREALAKELETELKQSAPNSLIHYSLLMEQIGDTLFFEDLQGHGIKENKVLLNISEFMAHFIQTTQPFISQLAVKLDYSDSQESIVKLATQVSIEGYSLYSHAKKNQHASVDGIWIDQMLRRLVRLFSLISLQSDKTVMIRSGFNDKDELALVFAAKSPLDIGFAVSELTHQNYGTLQGNQALNYGSGLEGVLIKKITDALNYEFTLKFDQKSSIITATILLPTTRI